MAVSRRVLQNQSEKGTLSLSLGLTAVRVGGYSDFMRLPASLPCLASILLFTVSTDPVRAQEVNTVEMQDRANRVILTRALPLMEQAARAADLTPEQAVQVELLLQEQRRTLTLFLGFSGLSGDGLQSKLAEVLNATGTQLQAYRGPDAP